jgi:heme-degrading monooxygenase HmoA
MHQDLGSSLDLPATTPEPPYYAVIFTSTRTEGDNGYADMANAMVELARQQPGFLGVESARSESGLGITVSYWNSLESIRAWKENEVHLEAQRRGRAEWYQVYHTRVSKIDYDYRVER